MRVFNFWYIVIFVSDLQFCTPIPLNLLPERRANYKACQPTAKNLHLFALSKLFRRLRSNTDKVNNRI
jgi:hypothetical protein